MVQLKIDNTFPSGMTGARLKEFVPALYEPDTFRQLVISPFTVSASFSKYPEAGSKKEPLWTRDALPIAMIKEQCQDGVRSSLAINCSRGFRYVRYMSPSGTQYNLSELTFYGYKAPGDDSQFYQVTNLPTVVINTQGGKVITSKTTEVSSNVYIISREGKDLLSTTQTGVRVRGNASWDFPKKPYRIKFAEKHRVLGAPANDK